MADTYGQADIRGLNIQKLVVGFGKNVIQLKKFLRQAKTVAREVRYFSKTAGFVAAPTTTAITGSLIANTDFGSRPVVVQQTYTRNTTYVRKYMLESEWIPEEDIKDCDATTFAVVIQDLVEGVANQINARCWSILSNGQSGTGINSVATNAPWDTASGTGVDIVEDLMECKMKLKQYNYNPEEAVLLVNYQDFKAIMAWLITIKGSSIPQFSSERIKDGTIMEILGLRVITDENVTADYALVFVPGKSAAWHEFMGLQSAVIEEKGIGRKIRVWEEGEATLEHPYSVCLITNTRA